MVGTVDDMTESDDRLSYLLRVKLATNFGRIDGVRVISKNDQEEQRNLEKYSEQKK